MRTDHSKEFIAQKAVALLDSLKPLSLYQRDKILEVARALNKYDMQQPDEAARDLQRQMIGQISSQMGILAQQAGDEKKPSGLTKDQLDELLGADE